MKRKSVSLVKVLFVMLLIAIAVVVTIAVMDNKKENTNVQNQVNDVSNSVNNVTVNEVANNVESNTVENTTSNDVETPTMSKKAYPGGFAGAGMHEVELYSNGEVYLVVYDGAGKESRNIVSKGIIAKNANDITENEQGGVDISGKEAKLLTSDYPWIQVIK